MRILYLGSGSSLHAVRWARAIARRGHTIHFVTQHPLREPIPECTVEMLPFSGPSGYLLNVWALRRLTQRLRPDVVHVNYATGYGTLARVAAVSSPIVLTVFGTDVLEFPNLGRWHRALLIGNLKNARVITSASRAMADVVRALLPGADIAVVPFGVDTSKFRPLRTAGSPDALTIGTVKGLDPVYGVDVLLRAFSLLPRDANRPIRLMIAGSGPQQYLRELSEDLGISSYVSFLGDIPHDSVPCLLNTFSVYAALSRSEGFGVAAAEASACGVPIVVTRVGGLPEVVQDGVTGFLVPSEDPPAAAIAIGRLIEDSQLRSAMGRAGSEFVGRMFEWDRCVSAMLDVYNLARDHGVPSNKWQGGVSAGRPRVSIDA